MICISNVSIQNIIFRNYQAASISAGRDRFSSCVRTRRRRRIRDRRSDPLPLPRDRRKTRLPLPLRRRRRELRRCRIRLRSVPPTQDRSGGGCRESALAV